MDLRGRKVIEALLKVLAVAVVVGVLIGGGTYLAARSLGLHNELPAAKRTTSASPSALPTVAVDNTPESEPSGKQSADDKATAKAKKKKKRKPKGDLRLSASPMSVGPSQRINLTGSYGRKDNVSLQIQRREAGQWTSFSGLQTTVRVGRFATYVQTGRTGVQVFRVYDPAARKGSNVVKVRVG